MSRIEAVVTPAVLSWARETAGLSVEEAAKKLKRSTADVVAWESGQSRPSVAQARKASEAYRRPLAVFYLPDPPEDFDTLRDYRSLPLDEVRAYGPKLMLLMRTALEHQQWTKDFLLDEGAENLSFVGSANVHDSPVDVANNILNTLGIESDEQCRCRTRADALLMWLRKAERAGIFVFREGKVDLRECRGFVVSDEIAPFIYINSEDARAAQMFTLVHELAHVWLNQSGVSNLFPFGLCTSSEASVLESFCNKVASEALLVRPQFEDALARLVRRDDVEDQIDKLSNIFKVSEEAIARRLLDDGRISTRKYRELRDYYQSRWRELKQAEKARMKKKDGGPSFYVTKVANNGYAYTQTVISAFRGGSISGREASALLRAKVNHISKLAMAAGFPLSSRGGRE